MMNKLLLLVVFFVGLALVEPHGFLLSPLARTSVHRLPNWGGASQPFWWDDTGVWCGNINQDVNFSTCGRCGDAPGSSHAARGGRYDKAIVTGTYTAGSQIDVVTRMTANHRGNIDFELCNINDGESDTCFQRLNIVSGSMPIRNGNTICAGDTRQVDIQARLQLPANFRCTRCTLRWTYRTSYPPAPDACFQPLNAQTFRNCADITIL